MDEPAHMTPAEFRALGHRMVDWIADYMGRVDELPVCSRVEPGWVLARLPEHPPERGMASSGDSWDAVFADLESTIVPGLTHWQSGRFFGYFPCNATGPGVLGELLSAGLGVQGMLWQTSPACTELETRVLDWMAELIGLADRFRSTSPGGGGVIQGTASESTLVAMVAARGRVRRRLGNEPAELVAYTSTQAHSSVRKAAMIAGVGAGLDDDVHLRTIETDERLAMDPRALGEAIAEDLDFGRVPFYVCATVGTTSTTAIDPIGPIREAMSPADHLRPWLHVDAALAGAACVCPEHRWMLEGVERADSICFNPHKWLLTNFDCDCFWTADREALTRALSVTPPFLRNAPSESGSVIDYRDWQIPLGRRFRSLKLWFVLRHYGAEGLQAHVRRGVGLAERFEAWVRGDDRFEIAAARPLNLVCFRLSGDDGASDRRNLELLEAVNAGGRAFLTHTTIPVGGRDRVVLRMAIGSVRTEEAHVREAWEQIRDHATRVLAGR